METPTTLTMRSVNTNEDADLNTKYKILPQIFSAFAATISAFGMGTVEAYTSPGIPSMQEQETFGTLDTNQQSMIAFMALLGAIISGPPAGWVIGRIGRKSSLMILSIPAVAGWFLIASSVNLTTMYLGRLLTGFCAGSASLIVPIFIGEISEDRIRGMLCSGFQLMVTLGNASVYVAGTYISWNWLAFACGIVPLVGLLFMVFTPASPTFLLSRGRVYDAIGALMALRGSNNFKEVEREFEQIQSNLNSCKADSKSYRDLFKLRTLRPMAICSLLLFFQQATGIETILVFTVFVFEQTGSQIDSHYSAIIIGILQVIATFVSALLVDKIGRRILLMISELGAAVTMLFLAIYFYLKESDPSFAENFSWIPLASLALFIIFFSFGIGPVSFLMVAELNSAAVIGIASAVTTTLNWTFASLITLYFMDLQIAMGLDYCFAIFSVLSFTGIAFVFFFVPETKGKSMEEIQNHFRRTTSTKVIMKDLHPSKIAVESLRDFNDIPTTSYLN